MIHLSDTLHFEPTKIYQKPDELKQLALPVELLLLLLFLFCSACANTPGQPSAMNGETSTTSKEDIDTSGASMEMNDQAASCGRLSYPKYEDVENQKIVSSDIQSGSAQVILHFHELGQATLDAFLARTQGVLEIESQWPDWGAISITVNESGLRQLSSDCAVRVIEANKREFPQ
jgi:hypothetical protein